MLWDGEARTNASITVIPGALSQVVVAPNPTDIGMGMKQQFVAAGADRFGNRISGLQFIWRVENGGGTINSKGLFTAGAKPATYNKTVKATSVQGNITISQTARVTVEPDRIAFTSMRDNTLRTIYIINADGSDVRQLTTADSGFTGASWSPDGRRIVYNSCPDHSSICNIFAVNDDGSFPTFLSGNHDLWPSWSPDGSKIAFASPRDSSDRDIYVMDVDGGDITRVFDTEGTDFVPSWSPDGKQIIFASHRNRNTDVYVMELDGGKQTKITGALSSDRAPAWSPDGTKIAYVSFREDLDPEIYLMNSDGSGIRRLTRSSGQDNNPSWSPDGRMLVFESERDEDTLEIYTMNADDSNLQRLTQNSFLDFFLAGHPEN